jgi:hypothetical protein
VPARESGLILGLDMEIELLREKIAAMEQKRPLAFRRLKR